MQVFLFFPRTMSNSIILPVRHFSHILLNFPPNLYTFCPPPRKKHPIPRHVVCFCTIINSQCFLHLLRQECCLLEWELYNISWGIEINRLFADIHHNFKPTYYIIFFFFSFLSFQSLKPLMAGIVCFFFAWCFFFFPSENVWFSEMKTISDTGKRIRERLFYFVNRLFVMASFAV